MTTTASQHHVLGEEQEAPLLLQQAAQEGHRVLPCGHGNRFARVFRQEPQADWRLSTAKLNQLHWLDQEDQTCEVGVGMSPEALQAAIAPYGLELGVEAPSSQEGSLGGLFFSHEVNLLHQSYGHAREQVLGMHAFLADGTPIQSGSRVVKSVAGYDLTRLLLGSEGRLALATRLTLRLHPRPKSLDWRRLPIHEWRRVRRSLPCPRYALQLEGEQELYLAWPSPLPMAAQSWPAIDPQQGEAARQQLLHTFTKHRQRIALSQLPVAPLSSAMDWNSLQTPWPAEKTLPAEDPEAQLLPPLRVSPTWASLRQALAPEVPHFGPQDA